GAAAGDRPARSERPDGERKRGQRGDAATPQPPAPVDAPPPPVDDRAAQEAITPQTIAPVTSERGQRRQHAPDLREQERQNGTDVLREIGNRLILQLGNQTFVESDEQPRLSRGARDVYYEDLPRGR